MFRTNANRVWMLSVALTAPAMAATWCVNPAGTGGCTKTIGAAVSAASAGDAVEVAAGTYSESVTIGKSLMLFGAGAGATIIDATSLANGIYVDGIDNANLSGVVIAGFTVRNANYEGIVVTSASNVTIMNNLVTGNDKSLMATATSSACPGIPAWETNEADDCGEGIHLSGVNTTTILNNNVTGNAGGILLSDEVGPTTLNVITGNSVTNNVLDCGITLASHVPAASVASGKPQGVFGNVIVSNTSTGNGGAGVGIFSSAPGTMSYGNLAANNVLTGNGLPGVSIHGHTPNQVLNGNKVLGNTLGGNAADDADAATPGTAGINIYSVTPVAGTLVLGNTISNENISVAWHAPGEARVQNNVFGTQFGVYNLGPGTVTADNNWWGCSVGPNTPIAALVGCGSPAGNVTINNWMLLPPASH